MTSLARDRGSFRDDMVVGFTDAYRRYVERVPQASGVRRRGAPFEGKVSLIVGGGSGHYPAFAGFVGAGMADAAVVGEVFTSPSAKQAYEVARAVDGGAGVLFSFGNYAGDAMNFGVAQERLRSEGIDCRTVVVTDDVASAPVGNERYRRGVAGMVAVFKMAGACAAQGASLEEVERIARKTNDVTRTIGVAFAGCTLPGHDEPLFTVPVGMFEVGLGIHGEPGVESVPIVPPAELARLLVARLMVERPADGRAAAVILNGLGGIKYEELFGLWRVLAQLFGDADVRPVLPEVGELVTSFDMVGCSLTLCWLDEELERLWRAPVDTPSFRRGDIDGYPNYKTREMASHLADEMLVEEAGAEGNAQDARVTLALDAMLRTIMDNEQELGRLDAVAGDGDHGTGMVRGLRAAKAAAEATRSGVGQVLCAAGRAFAGEAGGTSGLLWGVLLETVGEALTESEESTSERVAEAVHCGVRAVERLGGAKLGDKTMLDVLIPFADTLSDEFGHGAPLVDAWVAATSVAEKAAVGTASMAPRMGRARPLAARSIGSPDPGAVSMWLCFSAVSELLVEGTLR